MRRMIGSILVLLVLGFTAPTAWGADARLLTAADIAGMGGTDFKGGIGDYLLRNDKVEAVLLAVDEQASFGTPRGRRGAETESESGCDRADDSTHAVISSAKRSERATRRRRSVSPPL